MEALRSLVKSIFVLPKRARSDVEFMSWDMARFCVWGYVLCQLCAVLILMAGLWPYDSYVAVWSGSLVFGSIILWCMNLLLVNFNYTKDFFRKYKKHSAFILNVVLGFAWAPISILSIYFPSFGLHTILGFDAFIVVVSLILLSLLVPYAACFFVSFIISSIFLYKKYGIINEYTEYYVFYIIFCLFIIYIFCNLVKRIIINIIKENKYENKILSILSSKTVKNDYWVWETDRFGKVRLISNCLCRALGVSDNYFNALKFRDVLFFPENFEADQGPAWQEPMLRSARHLIDCFERQLAFRELDIAVTAQGRKIWCQMTGRPVYEDGVFQGYRGVGVDITGERSARIAHGQRARCDRDSGLPNRLAIVEHLQRVLLEKASVTGELVVCLIALGDLVGERGEALTNLEEGVVFREAAIRLMRESGSVYVGRYAGARLAVLTTRRPLSGCFDRVSVEAFMRRLHVALGEWVTLEDGRRVSLKPRIGAVLSMVENQRADLFLDAAETALHDVLHTEDVSFSVVDKVIIYDGERQSRLMDDVRHAVEKREFELVYQPIIHAQTGRIVGCEALSRWRGSVHGPVSIQKVIALIEQNGQSDTFDYWVLETACEAVAYWPNGVWVAVNMAATHFSVAGTAERILAIVQKAGIAPERLQIEITETFALDVGPQVSHALMVLNAAGVQLALDDFGTGYSAMDYLRLYPFSKIKVDASLVQDVLHNPRSKGILRSAVELSVDLGLSITAEGVSSPEHYRFLREAGCTELQGFCLGRPVDEKSLAWGRVMGRECFE